MQSDTTQTRLLEAAGEVFAERGYEAATVREICRRAEVSNLAAVNYYFGDKEQLYVAAVRQAFLGDRTTFGDPVRPTGTPAEKLRTFVRHFAEAVLGGNRRAWHLQLMSREMAQPSAGCEAFVREFAEPQFRALMGLLDGALPPGVPAGRRRLIAVSIIGQVVHHLCGRVIITRVLGEAEAATFTAGRVAEHVADFSLAALGLAPPLPSSEAAP